MSTLIFGTDKDGRTSRMMKRVPELKHRKLSRLTEDAICLLRMGITENLTDRQVSCFHEGCSLAAAMIAHYLEWPVGYKALTPDDYEDAFGAETGMKLMSLTCLGDGDFEEAWRYFKSAVDIGRGKPARFHRKAPIAVRAMLLPSIDTVGDTELWTRWPGDSLVKSLEMLKL